MMLDGIRVQRGWSDLPQVLALGKILVKDRIGVWVCEEVLSPSTLCDVSICIGRYGSTHTVDT